MKRQRSERPNNKIFIDLSSRLMTHKLSFQFTGIIVILFLMIVLSACMNDLQEIRSLDFADTLPDLSARDIEIIYSESARVKTKLVSPFLRSTEGKDSYIEFPDGFIIIFYDSLMQVKSRISADYGISYEQKKLMVARYNVIVENLEKGEQLNTEELYWDQGKEIIYTDKYVKFTRGDEIITGDGLLSDQAFESVEIKNAKGLIEVIDEETEDRSP